MNAKKLITTLGKPQQQILLQFLNSETQQHLQNIKAVKKFYGYSTVAETWDWLKLMYNSTLTNKASKIAKLFQNFRKPRNAEKNFKTNDGWEKQFVDVYNIQLPVPAHYNSYQLKDTILTKVLSLLGGLYNRYHGGMFQIDFDGRWIDEDGNEAFSQQDTQRVSMEAIELRPSNYKILLEKMMSVLKPPDTKSVFQVYEIIVKFIKPMVGGCYNCEGRGKNMKLGNITLHSPYSTNNNCLFKVIEEYLDFKPTKLKCNEIRAKLGIQPNEMITIQDAYKIVKNYTTKSVTFVTNDLLTLYGDEEGEIEIFCIDNHYQSFVREVIIPEKKVKPEKIIPEKKVKNIIPVKCQGCGQIYVFEGHKCNPETANYYKAKICKVIAPKVKNVESKLKDKEILHYDIETQYNNKTRQHMPYIVGFCYYYGFNPIFSKKWNKNKKEWIFKKEGYENYDFRYGIFTGDDCMLHFYDFLGEKDLECVKYINAFNGSSFDHYYLFREELNSDKTIQKFILNSGALLAGTIQEKKLIDLCRHLTGTLDSNLKQAGCSIAKGKINHDLSVRWEETTEERKNEVLEYLKCDVLGLRELYEKVNEPLFTKYNINLCDKVTTSANAFGIWRDFYLDENEICLLNAKDDINARQAIYGARCYKNKNRFESQQYNNAVEGTIGYDEITDYIFDADKVSLYPTAMAWNLYPVGKEQHTGIYQKGKLGIYKIDYVAPKNLLNPILPRKVNKQLVWDLNDGTGWYCSVDIENARAKGYKINVLTGIFWDKSAYVFKDYIEEFYKMKQNSVKGTPNYNTAKLYLNGLYGKMLQRPINTTDCIIKTIEELWVILNKNIILEMKSLGKSWIIKYTTKDEFVEPNGADKPTQLGVFILAYSRSLMNSDYDKCGNTIDRLPYYYDTDSLNIHSSCLDTIKIDKNLGGLDDDIGGKIIKAIYIAPKTYAFKYVTKDMKIHYHFRGKGVCNDELAWEHYEIMDKNQSVSLTRPFQMKKINTKEIAGYDCFSHKHIFRKDTEKTINQQIWSGRYFYDDNNSVPHGYDLSLLPK